MIRLGKFSSFTTLVLTLAAAASSQAATNSSPDFKEVYDSIRAHVAGVSDSELNQAAVSGLLKELGPKASLVTGQRDEPSPTNVTPVVSRAVVFENDFAYLRVARVADGLAGALKSAYQPLNETNKLKGVVLDLRFANGADYAAAVTTAELFALKKPATLDWGKTSQEAKTGADMVSAPLIVLINRETSSAAEALAALLRDGGAGLILGSSSAGHALLSQDFPLSDGATLRVATASVKLDGAELASVHPDIEIAVGPADEKSFFADAYVLLPRGNPLTLTNKLAGTNSPGRRVRLTEAELVRAHRQGLNPAEDEEGFIAGLREAKPEAPVVSDPVLARALDLLKGLAIVRPARP